MNFEEQSPDNMPPREVEVVQKDPDSIRLYFSHSDTFVTIDINFPDIKSHDDFFSSSRTFDDFVKLGGKFTLSGEFNPSEVSFGQQDNASALEAEESKFDHKDHGITDREFRILNATVIKNFFRSL